MRPLLLLLCCLVSLVSTAQTLPADRRSDWSHPGYPGEFPDSIPVYDVSNFGIFGDGLTDQHAALSTLIGTFGGARALLYFPPGDYRLGQTLHLPDSLVLRGAGADSTRLTFDLGGAASEGISVRGGANGTWFPLTGGYERSSDRLIVNDGGVIQTGDWIESRQRNGSWDTQPISWADYSLGQILQVVGRSGDTLLCDRALRISYDATLVPEVSVFTPAREVGLECFSIVRSDNVAASFCPLIDFRHAVNCYVKGLDIGTSISAHILLDASAQITVTGCYLHDAFEYDGASMHGYGLALYFHTSDCLIEDNIFRNLRHSFSFQCGANGNVVAYNYSREPNRSEFPANYGADISMHGHYPYANLFEGNIVQNIQLDQTWGPSGPRNTFFRNRAELYGILMTSAAAQSDSQAFVGNEVPNTGLFLGNYTLAGSGHFEYGNMVRGTLTPAGTSVLPDSSFYLNAVPVWWNGSSWPGIGVPYATGSGSNPAYDRYAAGGPLTVCERAITTGLPESQFPEVQLFPNPAGNALNIRWRGGATDDQAIIRIFDAQGHRVLETQRSAAYDERISVQELPAGCYLVKILNKGKILTQRLVLLPR
jgi:hypothetical protein